MKKKFTFLPALAVLLAVAVAPVNAVKPVNTGGGKALSIIKGPYLQQVTTDSIVIMWETKTAADSQVDYDDGVSDPVTVTDSTKVKIHEVQLTNLAADKAYYYTVTSVDKSKTVTSDPSTFATAPEAERSFRFVAYGDTRTYPDDHAAVVQGIINSAPELVIHTGDLVESGDSYGQWGPQFFTPAKDLMIDTPLLPIIGNHEGSGNLFRDFFSLPNNEQWFAFSYSNVRFIGLNTYNASYSPTSAQYLWLLSEFASSKYISADWQIVYFHNPVYSSGTHGGTAGVQTNLVPLFEQYGVDMVFNGDDHIYERSFKDGVYYIVTGGGGAPLRAVNVNDNPYQQYAESTFHHCVIDVAGETLTLSARYNDGTEFDAVMLIKTAKASNPNPADGATDVDIDADLSWTAGIDAVSHNVYFGADPGNLLLVSELQGGTTYEPETLQEGTTYYWAIDEFDSGNNLLAAGDVWSFTTGVPPMVPAGSTWKYDDTNTDYYSAGWPSVDDTSWPTGAAPLGYGDPHIVPPYLTMGTSRYPCYYFRYSFDVADPTIYETLTVKVLRDDGCVVYLNGTEIVRSNMPGGEITHSTLSSTTVGGADETTYFEYTVDPALLLTGTNVLAVDVHQTNSTSSDLGFDLELSGVEAAVGQPVAEDDAYSVNEDTALNVAVPGVLGNDSDPEEDPLTAVLDSDVSNGALALNSDGSFSYTPDADFSGTDSFTYRANDGIWNSNVATVTITVNPTNDAPVANDDSATTQVDTAVTIDVLDNDTDADGDTLTVDSVTQGTYGSVVNNGIDVTYTPTGGIGDDTFTYTVSDSQGGTDSATVTVTVIAPPPLQLPGEATDPNPSEDQTRVNRNTVILSWLAGTDATSNDVYLGTDHDSVMNAKRTSAEFKGNQTQTTYDPPAALGRKTMYYWRIDEVNAAGTTPGVVWSFTTN